MNIFLAPRSNERSYQNFQSTIEEGRKFDDIKAYLDDEGKKILSSDDNLFAWGNKESLKSRWDKMKTGDYVFFYRKRFLNYVGRLKYKQFSNDLGLKLWPPDVNEEPWNCIFFLEDLQQINVPILVINKLAGYSENFIVQGFQALKKEGLDNLIKEYKSIDNFINEYQGKSSLTKKVSEPNKLELEKIINILDNKKQLILYGPPGTGKTYNTKNITVKLINHD